MQWNLQEGLKQAYLLTDKILLCQTLFIKLALRVYVENTNIAAQNGRQGYWTNDYNDVKSNYVKTLQHLK
jgi:hypothetical protein